MQIRENPRKISNQFSTAALIDLSLRNHLRFNILRTEHGRAFHLGTIVRTLFASFFPFDAGFGDGDISIFANADACIGEAAVFTTLDAPFSLKANALTPTARLLALYDQQLQTAPLIDVVTAHQLAERNLGAMPHERRSIAALLQQSSRRPRKKCR
jgi:hypothetical protein